ncbi:hypothetical protein KSF78_0005570 [Schistosoma japonicum]|nr:hypothetical protein KSF78_0005570 [Schistosoma japonicum]
MMTTVQRPSMDVILAKLTETDKQYNQLLNEMINNNEKETLMIKPVRFGIYRRRNRRRNHKRHKKQKCSKKDYAFSMYQNDKVYQPSIDKIFTNIKEIEQNDSWSKYTKINEPDELVIAPVKYDRSRRYAKLHKKALRRQRRAIKLQKRLYRRHYRGGYKHRPYRS